MLLYCLYVYDCVAYCQFRDKFHIAGPKARMKVLCLIMDFANPKQQNRKKWKNGQRKMRSIREWYLTMLAATLLRAKTRHDIFLGGETCLAWETFFNGCKAKTYIKAVHGRERIDLPSSLLTTTTFNFWVSFHHLVPSMVVWNTGSQSLWYHVSINPRSSGRN